VQWFFRVVSVQYAIPDCFDCAEVPELAVLVLP